MNNLARQVADQIAALINSQPHSPHIDQLEAIVTGAMTSRGLSAATHWQIGTAPPDGRQRPGSPLLGSSLQGGKFCLGLGRAAGHPTACRSGCREGEHNRPR
jgi:hypothetical protein